MRVYIDISFWSAGPVALTRLLPLTYYLAIEWAYPAKSYVVARCEIRERQYSRHFGDILIVYDFAGLTLHVGEVLPECKPHLNRGREINGLIQVCTVGLGETCDQSCSYCDN